VVRGVGAVMVSGVVVGKALRTGKTKGPVSFLVGPSVFAGRNYGSDLD
jgi:hypothetical protein